MARKDRVHPVELEALRQAVRRGVAARMSLARAEPQPIVVELEANLPRAPVAREDRREVPEVPDQAAGRRAVLVLWADTRAALRAGWRADLVHGL